MKAFVQWLDYAVGAVIDQESGFWTKKPLDARLIQILAWVEYDGQLVYVNDSCRKRQINVFKLEGNYWLTTEYPKLTKKAPAWIHDPLSWQIRWENEVKKGTINERTERQTLHA